MCFIYVRTYHVFRLSNWSLPITEDFYIKVAIIFYTDIPNNYFIFMHYFLILYMDMFTHTKCEGLFHTLSHLYDIIELPDQLDQYSGQTFSVDTFSGRELTSLTVHVIIIVHQRSLVTSIL